MVVRSHDSSQVGKFSDVCDDVLLSLPSDVQESILKNTLNIDTIGDILIIETDKFVIFNHIKTIFDTSSIQPVSNPVIISKHSELSNYIVSDWYYNKEMNHILLCTLNTEDDTLYNTTDQVITKAKLYWIDIDRFELSTTQPTLNWHEDGDTVLSKSFTDLSSAKISYNEVLKKYYVTFLGYLSQDQGDFSFAIGQVMIPNQTTNIGEINIYTSTSPAMFKDASRTLEDRRVVSNVYRQVNPVKSVSTGFNNEVVFENSLSNNLSLDLTLLSSGKTATSVIIDFGDSTANYEKTRLPLIRYDKVDQLVGSDTRNPLDYKVDHTYSNDSPEYICTITVNTMETPTTSDVYTIQVIQKQSDLTTSFNPLETIQSSSAAGIISTNYRQNTPGISINQAKIFVDKFGAENMLLMLKTAHPEFITPVLIKLAQPLRRSKSFDMNNENMLSTDSIDQERITRAMLAQVS